MKWWQWKSAFLLRSSNKMLREEIAQKLKEYKVLREMLWQEEDH